MQTATFKDLGRAACHTLNGGDIAFDETVATLMLDDAIVTLEFDEEIDDDCLCVHVQMPGTEKLTQNLDVLRSLLALNMLSGSKTNGVFAMHPRTVQLTDLDQFTSTSLSEILRILVAQGVGGIGALRNLI
jgi:hypothetical protein